MRRWWTDAVAAADVVAGRADLWLPGALAWTVTRGWLPIVVAVAHPPTAADLTFLGARVYTSGAWPWNAIGAATGLVLLTLAAFSLVAVAETVLIGAGRRGLTIEGVSRVAAIGVVTAVPALAALIAGGTAFVVAAIGEFNAPGVADPLVRSLSRVWPYLAAVPLAWLAAAAAHAAASRHAVLRRAGLVEAVAAIPRRLRATGPSGLASALASAVATGAYLAVAALLLSVLWDPIEVRLAVDGIDATGLPLLVGFVAIWLCLVLGGGALHAWASVTWTRVLAHADRGLEGAGTRTQGAPHRP